MSIDLNIFDADVIAISRELTTKGLPAASAASSGSGEPGSGTAIPDLLETPVSENKDPNQLASSDFPIE